MLISAVSKYTADTVPRADLVVVWIGQTDVLRGEIAIEDVSTGTEQYTKLLGKVRELRPETPILCLYPEEVIHSSHPASRTLLVDSGVAAAGFEPDSAYARQKVGIVCTDFVFCIIHTALNTFTFASVWDHHTAMYTVKT